MKARGPDRYKRYEICSDDSASPRSLLFDPGMDTLAVGRGWTEGAFLRPGDHPSTFYLLYEPAADGGLQEQRIFFRSGSKHSSQGFTVESGERFQKVPHQ